MAKTQPSSWALDFCNIDENEDSSSHIAQVVASDLSPQRRMKKMGRFFTESSGLSLLDGCPSDVSRTFINQIRSSKSLHSLRDGAKRAAVHKRMNKMLIRRGSKSSAPPQQQRSWVTLIITIALCSMLAFSSVDVRVVKNPGVSNEDSFVGALKLSSIELQSSISGSHRQATINAVKFLDAIDTLEPVFDDNVMFSVGSSQITQNVVKLRKALAKREKDDVGTTSLQELVEADVALKQHNDGDSAYQALLWLGFGLHFLEHVQECVGKGERSPIFCSQDAYELTLMPHHNAALRMISSGALRLLSSQGASIGEGPSSRAAMTAWAKSMKRPRQILEQFYSRLCPNLVPAARRFAGTPCSA